MSNQEGLEELKRRRAVREAAVQYGGDPVGAPQGNRKFCQHCGEVIDADCIICPACGKQVGQVKSEAPQVVINNSNQSSNVNTNTNVVANVNTSRHRGRRRNKWTAFFLCLLLGLVGAHKFYDGKIGMGILYACTLGLCGIGWIIDLIRILSRPNPYYVPY